MASTLDDDIYDDLSSPKKLIQVRRKPSIDNLFECEILEIYNDLSEIQPSTSSEIKTAFSKYKNIFYYILYILSKSTKNERDILILSLYLNSLKNFIHVFDTISKSSRDETINKICIGVKEAIYNQNNLMCKYGDKGDKCAIILKGKAAVLVPYEIIVKIKKIDYLKYLISLFIYQEHGLIAKCLGNNNKQLFIDEKALYQLFNALKVFYYYRNKKEHDKKGFMDKELRKNKEKKEYKNLYNFLKSEKKIENILYNCEKVDPFRIFQILKLPYNEINNCYEYYCKELKKINSKLEKEREHETNIINEQSNNADKSKSNENIFYIKSQILSSLRIRANSISDINSINIRPSQIKLNEILKEMDSSSKHQSDKDEDAFTKEYKNIINTHPISNENIYTSSIENYINRFSSILKNLHKESCNTDEKDDNTESNNDTKNQDTPENKEKNELYKTVLFTYYQVNTLDEGCIIGEATLNSLIGKRCATIITSSNCLFGILSRDVYNASLKNTQSAIRVNKINLFKNSAIFNGLSNDFFNERFLSNFSFIDFKKNDYFFRQNDTHDKILFIQNGELILTIKIKLCDIDYIIKKLDGTNDLSYVHMIKRYPELKQFYYDKEHYIKLCLLKHGDICGLDDCVINDYFFCDCYINSIIANGYITTKDFINTLISSNEDIKKNTSTYIKLKKSVLVERLLSSKKSILNFEVMRVLRNQKMLQIEYKERHKDEKKTITRRMNLNRNLKNDFFNSNLNGSSMIYGNSSSIIGTGINSNCASSLNLNVNNVKNKNCSMDNININLNSNDKSLPNIFRKCSYNNINNNSYSNSDRKNNNSNSNSKNHSKGLSKKNSKKNSYFVSPIVVKRNSIMDNIMSFKQIKNKEIKGRINRSNSHKVMLFNNITNNYNSNLLLSKNKIDNINYLSNNSPINVLNYYSYNSKSNDENINSNKNNNILNGKSLGTITNNKNSVSISNTKLNNLINLNNENNVNNINNNSIHNIELQFLNKRNKDSQIALNKSKGNSIEKNIRIQKIYTKVKNKIKETKIQYDERRVKQEPLKKYFYLKGINDLIKNSNRGLNDIELHREQKDNKEDKDKGGIKIVNTYDLLLFDKIYERKFQDSQ